MELSRRDQIVGNVRVGVTGFADALNMGYLMKGFADALSIGYLMKGVCRTSRAFCLSCE